MTPSLRRIGLALGAVGALAAGVIGCGGSAESSDQAASATTQQQQPAGAPAQGAPDLSALAEELGVSTEKLQAAMQEARPDQGSSPQDMTAALAEALGVSEDKVAAAMENTRPSGTPPEQPQQQQES
jgi:hypothetical protein